MADPARQVQTEPLSDPSPPGLPTAEGLEADNDKQLTAAATTANQDQDQDNEDQPSDNEDGTTGAMPLTLAASVVLTALPQDAHAALEGAGELAQDKVTVRFQPVGSAPQLRQRVFKISSRQRFAAVVSFLRRRLGVRQDESVFCYVNSVFAPGLDEGVGNLWRCFKKGDELVVAYAKTPAFG